MEIFLQEGEKSYQEKSFSVGENQADAQRKIYSYLSHTFLKGSSRHRSRIFHITNLILKLPLRCLSKTGNGKSVCNPVDGSLPDSSVHGNLQARILEWVFPYPGDLPNPGIKPRSPTLQADILPAEPPGKPKNSGVGSLSLLQGTFPTQELNQVSCIAGGFFTS